MKNMKLITEAWKKFVNEGNGGYGEEEEEEYPYPQQTPEEEEEDRKFVNNSKGDAIKAAYAAFQRSSSKDALARGGWIHSLRDLGEIIHNKVREYSSLQHGKRPFEEIINKHLAAIKPDTDKEAYLEGTIKQDPDILRIVNDALDKLEQEIIKAPPSVSKPEPGSRGYYAQQPGLPAWYRGAMTTEGKEPKARR